MAPLINARDLGKRFGADPLFSGISFSIEEADRIGIIGPNGSGKSTLLGILAGTIDSDEGEVARRRLSKTAFVSQVSEFSPGDTPRSVLTRALKASGSPSGDHEGAINAALGRAGFEDFDTEAVTFSGGWKKRLAIAEALVTGPDVLLLDEPTNHLDLEGIEWLESLLVSSQFATVVISHDRYFLENVATSVVEINRAYPNGAYRVKGSYSQFLVEKDEFLAAQAKRQESLENRVRREVEWLRRGPKARTTKSKARIDKAHELINELGQMSSRAEVRSAGIELSASGRQTKRLVALENVACSIPGRELFSGLTLPVVAGARIGLAGPNGSGKTTLLRLISGQLEPSSGKVERAPTLRVVSFSQNREIDTSLTLRRALAPDSDGVVYQGNMMHVASWAARFLFTGEQLNQPVSRLSGGERARVLIARMMLEPADLLLLDEPTNDLDIPTLEILEESLLDYSGALLLVTHDRYLMDRVATTIVGLNGNGQCGVFADYRQWEEWLSASKRPVTTPAANKTTESSAVTVTSARSRKKLSYKDAREWEFIEDNIGTQTERVEQLRAKIEDPSLATNAAALEQASLELSTAEDELERLYTRWAELEALQES